MIFSLTARFDLVVAMFDEQVRMRSSILEFLFRSVPYRRVNLSSATIRRAGSLL